MKRNMFIAALCTILALPAVAQDVISYGYPCYMFNYIDTNCFDLTLNHNVIGVGGSANHTFGALKYDIPETEETTIYGIAITARRPKEDPDSGGYTVYMYMVEDSNKLICIDSASKYTTTMDFRYWGRLEGQYGDTIVTCYEYIFPQPHNINNGPIYVGTKWSNYWGGIYLGVAQNLANAVPVYEMDSDTLHFRGFMYSHWGGIFPITKLGCDSCPEVHDIRFTKVGNSAAIAQWNVGDNHQDWQLCYGPQGFNPDSGQAMTTVAPQMAIGNLSPTAQYDVYIKARCHCCSTDEWTPWAGPYSLCLRDIGIDEAAAPEVTLSPNPTTGKLTIGCEAEIKEVEMYDMQGRMINGYWKAESGKCAVLDLAGLPAGSYILVAHTTKGVATRTVEKR